MICWEDNDATMVSKTKIINFLNDLKSSVKFMTSKFLNGLTKTGHGLDRMVDGVLGDLLPDLDQVISELLYSLYFGLINNAIEVLTWIQVWGT